MAEGRNWAIRRPPQDRPFTGPELDLLRAQLGDPATAASEHAAAVLHEEVPVAGAPVEIPNDARGLPPPPMELQPRRYRFVRRRSPEYEGGAWFWLCLD